MSCDDLLCVPKICFPASTRKCAYDLKYLSETLSFPPSPNKVIIDNRVLNFKGVVFGCGLQNEKVTFAEVPLTSDNDIGGIKIFS